MSLPAFTDDGNLPPGVHRATLSEVLQRFGVQTTRRTAVSTRLQRIWNVATATGQVERFVVFGSFVSTKPEPNDVDIFLLMRDTFDVRQLDLEALLLFDHVAAQAFFGASVFWLRRLAVLGGDQEAVEQWQTMRDGRRRGIIEIIPEPP